MGEAASTHEPAVEAGSLQGIDNRKFGVWLFIASEVMFFMALIGMFLAYRGQAGWADFHHLLDVPLTAVNTFVLLTSSLFVVLAVNAAQQGNRRSLSLWLLLTAIFGTVFVSVQAFEYS